jgi:hypothetical protein
MRWFWTVTDVPGMDVLAASAVDVFVPNWNAMVLKKKT